MARARRTLGNGDNRTLAALSSHVTHWSEFDTGGHFASLQAPDPLVADIRTFFRTLC